MRVLTGHGAARAAGRLTGKRRDGGRVRRLDEAKPDGYNHGSSGVGSTLNLEQFAELNRSEFDRYGKLVKAANIKAE